MWDCMKNIMQYVFAPSACARRTILAVDATMHAPGYPARALPHRPSIATRTPPAHAPSALFTKLAGVTRGDALDGPRRLYQLSTGARGRSRSRGEVGSCARQRRRMRAPVVGLRPRGVVKRLYLEAVAAEPEGDVGVVKVEGVAAVHLGRSGRGNLRGGAVRRLELGQPARTSCRRRCDSRRQRCT